MLRIDFGTLLLAVAVASTGCSSGKGSGGFECLTRNDCPPDCECDLFTSGLSGRCEIPGGETPCGGTCDRESCSAGTSCEETGSEEFGSGGIVLLFSCVPTTTLSCETACGQLDCVEFFDGAFEENDWLDEVVSVTPDPGFGMHEVDQGGVPGSTAPDDGNPAPYRFVSHTVGESSGIWVAHEKPTANYDPSSAGAIESIHYLFDGRALEGSRQASIRPLAKQDGRWFWTDFTTFQLINENGWVTKRWDDASLIPAGHSVELDLSGGQITVGFATGASHTTGVEMVTRNTGVDNWRVVICHQ